MAWLHEVPVLSPPPGTVLGPDGVWLPPEPSYPERVELRIAGWPRPVILRAFWGPWGRR